MVTPKKTKIVATIGPKSESKEQLERMIRAGMNVMRLNMSHGSHEDHRRVIRNGRAAAQSLGASVAILLDLSGPKIRTGSYDTERITLTKGESCILTTEDLVGNKSKFSVNYSKLPTEVKKGSIIMLDDGKKKLIVERVAGNEIHTRVVVGGEMKSRRGVNVPGAYLSIETITKKDKQDLLFGLQEGIDVVALSFVRRAQDVLDLKKMLSKKGCAHIPVISKIETQEAIENLDEILAASDGAMVARGDLAIEIPAESVPRWQKEMIRKCNQLGKPVITATQMLESMIHSPVPTRAEVSDVANAIYDGSDAVMLSEESTLGAYPVEAVETLTRIAHASEIDKQDTKMKANVQDEVTAAVATLSRNLNAQVIVALTESGASARMVARLNPACLTVALTPHEETTRALALSKGIYAYTVPALGSFEESLAFVPQFLLSKKIVRTGDVVIVTAGLKFGVKGTTNAIVALKIGEGTRMLKK
jgi:pyruvate kinase